MSGWYYMKEGWLDDSENGPITDATMLQMAFEGDLKLRTKLRHPTHTKNQWCFLEHVPAAKKKVEDGITERARVADEEVAAKLAASELAKKERAASKGRHTHEVFMAAAVPENPLTLSSPFVPATTLSQPSVPQFRCPFCSSTMPPTVRAKTSTGGWIMFVILFLLLCWPLCWIGLFLTEDFRYCSQCGVKLG